MKIIVILITFLLSSVVTAQLYGDDSQQRKNYSEKARMRAYDGGIDEQPLTVQTILLEPRVDGSEYVLQRRVLNDSESLESPTEDVSGDQPSGVTEAPMPE